LIKHNCTKSAYQLHQYSNGYCYANAQHSSRKSEKPGFESGNDWGWSLQGTTEARVTGKANGIVPGEGQWMYGWSGYQIGARSQTIYQTVQTDVGQAYLLSVKVYTDAAGGLATDTTVRLERILLAG